MTTKYSHEGRVIDYVNTTGGAIASGAVVKMGNILGVALVDIAIGATGAVGFGVFTGIPKVSAAVIAQGESLTWDVSAVGFDDNAATPATGDVTGAAAVAFAAAGNGVTTMTVCFTGVPGTVT
ncbi:MAG: capsid cement protein [Ramlibacter sp.]